MILVLERLYFINQLLTAAAANKIPSVMKNSEQTGSSSLLNLSPLTPVSVKKYTRHVSMQSSSKRCKHLYGTLDEDRKRHKKGDQLRTVQHKTLRANL